MAAGVGLHQPSDLCHRGFPCCADYSPPHAIVCDLPGTYRSLRSFPLGRDQGLLQKGVKLNFANRNVTFVLAFQFLR